MISFRARDRVVSCERPLVMAVLNATPDSFSEVVDMTDLARQREHLQQVIDAAADVVDIGGQSAITGVAEVSVDEEVSRVAAIVAEACERGLLVSVDTYRAASARHVVELGAHIINDTSNVIDAAMPSFVAETGVGYVLTHNRSRPKERVTDPHLYDAVVDDVELRWRESIAAFEFAGADRQQLLLDFGPDFSKTPYQTIECLANVSRLAEFQRPLVMALSRKDFIGAALDLPPADRDAASLAAMLWVAGQHSASIFRTHRPADLRRALTVVEFLSGQRRLDPDALLPVKFRRSRGAEIR